VTNVLGVLLVGAGWLISFPRTAQITSVARQLRVKTLSTSNLGGLVLEPIPIHLVMIPYQEARFLAELRILTLVGCLSKQTEQGP
jgi:hypothetical protein